MLPSICFPSMVPGMLRNLLLAAILCPLALAQSPKPPATLAELKANPAGLTAYSGDIREAYGQFPVTSVYVRETPLGKVSYLLNGDKVFGYHFRFHKPGEDTVLWQESVNASLDAVFAKEGFRREEIVMTHGDNWIARTLAVFNTQAYDEAMQSFQQEETERLKSLVIGSGDAAGSGAVAVEKEEATPQVARPLADYLKNHPETQPTAIEIAPRAGMPEGVPGFEYITQPLAEFPYDALHRRKAGEAELLIVSRKGIIIGYFAKIAVKNDGSLANDQRKAGLVAAFASPAFKREDLGGGGGFYVTRIEDVAALKAARAAQLADEAARLKALLNP